MGGRWSAWGIKLSSFALVILVSEIHGSLSLNSEGLSLLKFRANVEFDPFGALANWNSNDCNPCMWSGIECLDGKVVMLNLNGQELEGVLAPELGNLTHLRILDLSKSHLSGTIPPQFGQLTKLEVLDLRDNNLSGTVPAELGGLHSLKRLFEGSIPVEIEKLSLLTDLEFDDTLPTAAAAGVGCSNRKVGHCIWQSVLKQPKKSDSFRMTSKWSITHYLNRLLNFKVGSESPHNHANDGCTNVTETHEPGVIQNINKQVNDVRRVLAEQSNNLVAIPPKDTAPAPSGTAISLPSRSSGSFPAVPNANKLSPTQAPSPPISSPPPPQENMPLDSPGAVSQQNEEHSSAGGSSGNSLKLIIGISSAVFLLIILAVIIVLSRSRAARTIGPWKSGLSGQLQKAFVTGVPKLNRDELETACEDFSNIIMAQEGVATLYKGTLSSGVEIAVASTVVASAKQWSKQAELAFRKKIDSLSRVNHKNYINLIGYCEEEEPFTRMMVFEFAPNGTLFEHLHDEDLEHLDWNARMRIIMGTAYCLQHMHDLNPPVVHANLASKEIFLTDDYAAKIGDVTFWSELIAKTKKTTENDAEHSELPPLAVETNIHSFGILLLEIISGKLPYSEEEGDIVNWACTYLNDKTTISQLIDPSLKSPKENELEVVCEVIQSCIQQDVGQRPSMKEIIQKLRQAIDISPEAATPRLSPLWWAELEILSQEAA
ncbi:protein MALE DISCOVERER 2 isoform X2 [Sesamum indicum]|uniref:Protein MALE DISCOVERER 2 isoform X2 n=1 Tax=Sesamum indicum TaxID=4182 RepID=A0A6I9UPG3_SESIN|nr:protein MALE DISCOVERER 2 isoform X2 [Sesamum indicum]